MTLTKAQRAALPSVRPWASNLYPADQGQFTKRSARSQKSFGTRTGGGYDTESQPQFQNQQQQQQQPQFQQQQQPPQSPARGPAASFAPPFSQPQNQNQRRFDAIQQRYLDYEEFVAPEARDERRAELGIPSMSDMPMAGSDFGSPQNQTQLPPIQAGGSSSTTVILPRKKKNAAANNNTGNGTQAPPRRSSRIAGQNKANANAGNTNFAQQWNTGYAPQGTYYNAGASNYNSGSNNYNRAASNYNTNPGSDQQWNTTGLANGRGYNSAWNNAGNYDDTDNNDWGYGNDDGSYADDADNSGYYYGDDGFDDSDNTSTNYPDQWQDLWNNAASGNQNGSYYSGGSGMSGDQSFAAAQFNASRQQYASTSGTPRRNSSYNTVSTTMPRRNSAYNTGTAKYCGGTNAWDNYNSAANYTGTNARDNYNWGNTGAAQYADNNKARATRGSKSAYNTNAYNY